MITCYLSRVLTLTPPWFHSWIKCKLSSSPIPQVNPKYCIVWMPNKLSSWIWILTDHCAARWSPTYSNRISTEFSITTITCSSSKNNSQSTTPSTLCLLTHSINQNASNFQHSTSVRQRAAWTSQKRSCSMLSLRFTTNTSHLTRLSKSSTSFSLRVITAYHSD